MSVSRNTVGTLFTASLLTVCFSNASQAADAPTYITNAVASVGRPPDDMARDVNRKPTETVVFAGVKPGDKVLELIPARGYYTRILSKVVGPKGKVYALAFGSPPGPGGRPPMPAGGAPAAGPPPGAPPTGNAAMPPMAGGPPGNPIDAVYRLSRSTEFNNIMPLLGLTMAGSGTIGLPELVVVVWTSDNYHDFHNKSAGPLNMIAINQSIFRNLKPGGVYIVIDHASAAGTGASVTETLHRIDVDTVKKEVLAAGFVLDAQSTMLTNAADDHSKPPFQMEGKTDEFVLRFKKPLNAAKDDRFKDSEMALYWNNTLVLGTPEQRNRTIFYQPDHTYQEFGAEGITNGLWYVDVNNNICMYHQTERAGAEGTVACRQMDFPMSKHPKLGDTFTGAQTGMMAVALLKGRVYPNMAQPIPPMAGSPPGAPPEAK